MARAADKRSWRMSRAVADTRGSAAIEAALAVPFLLLFVVGAAEFGNMLYNANMIQTGLRDAARYLARVPDPEAAEPLARNLAVTGTITGEAPPRVAWWRGDDVMFTYDRLDNPPDPLTGRRAFRAGPTLTVIRIETQIDYDGLGTLRVLGQDAVRLGFAHEERHVGE